MPAAVRPTNSVMPCELRVCPQDISHRPWSLSSLRNRDEHSLLANGTIDNYVVLCTRGNVTDGQNIETGVAKGTYDCKIAAFIGQKTHPSSLGRSSPGGSEG